MSYYFFDSSALVKRYIPETGTTWVRTTTESTAGNTIFVAHIMQVEIVSAVMRRSREGSVSARTSRAVRLLIDRHANREYFVVRLTPAVVQLAEDLLESHALRAYDSVQLASAIESNKRLITAGLSELTFVSADNRLLSVATSSGLMIENPNSYP